MLIEYVCLTGIEVHALQRKKLRFVLQALLQLFPSEYLKLLSIAIQTQEGTIARAI